jgi:hypothetical protein
MSKLIDKSNMRFTNEKRLKKSGLWIRINFFRIRIRIQSMMLETNTDPDPYPDPESGSSTDPGL